MTEMPSPALVGANPAAVRSRVGLWPMLMAIALVMVLVLYTVAYTVPAGSAAVVKYFGTVSTVTDQAGLHFKLPAPAHTVQLVDLRTRLLTLQNIEMATADSFTLHLVTTVEWRVTDPERYIASYASDRLAEDAVRTSANAARAAMGHSIRLDDLISVNPEQARHYAEFERRFLETLKRNLNEGETGVTADSLLVSQIALPGSATASIQEHMATQRRAIAQRFQQAGENEVRTIRAEAERQVSEIMADANALATAIRAEGDAAAAEALQAVSLDPASAQLVAVIKGIETLDKIVGPETLFILNPENPPFNALQPTQDRP